MTTSMSKEEHRERHIKLHEALDELFADFVLHNKDKRATQTPIVELISWSYKQTQNPTETNED